VFTEQIEGGECVITIGFPLALVASIIALYGVYLFNQVKDHTGARAVWFWSNSIFVLYFVGRSLLWWDGVLGDAAMALYFALMWWSNWRGMV
jgi:hypothetical protein